MALLNTTEGFKEGNTDKKKPKKYKHKSESYMSNDTNVKKDKDMGSERSSEHRARTEPRESRSETTMQNFENKKLNPELIDSIPSKKKMLDQVGEVDKIEKAYDSLDSALGKNSIRSINGATSELIKEQKEMLSQIKDITPTLEKALQNVSKIDLDKVLNTFNSMSKSMKTS